MGDKAAGRAFLKRLVIGAAWCADVLLWLSAASVLVSPAHCRYLSILGLAFPFFLLAVIAMQALTLIVTLRNAWVPLLGLVGAFFAIRAYCPVNFPSPAPKGALKILSYNTMSFGTSKTNDEGRNVVVDYIMRQRPDVACLQEAAYNKDIFEKDILSPLRPTLPYADTVHLDCSILMCLSRYPIVGRRLIVDNGSTNGAVDHYVRLPEGDTLHVVNCHLESMHLSTGDRQMYRDIVHNTTEKADSVEKGSRLLITKISTAAVERARQADVIADYIDSLGRDANVLLCGDFNDTPVSYTRHRIHSAGLTDAYAATGNGIGRSFHRDAIYVRIDHIMCSRRWKPYACRVDNTAGASDHYPITAYIKRR